MSLDLPGLRFLLRLLPTLLLLTLVAALALAVASRWKAFAPLVVSANPAREVYNLLRSETMAFLVTERLTSQITVEVDESSLWLGSSRGSLTGIVRMYYGVDLQKLVPTNVRMEGGVCVVELPEPAVLDFAVDVSTLTFRTQRSILQVISDRLRTHDLRSSLQSRFRSASESFFKEQQLLPDRAALCARLNEHAESWSGRVGVPVSFR